MSLVATQDVKDRIRQAVDIVDLVGGYIPLRRSGRIFLGNCPWHDDSRPSLQVNPDRGSWKCWVCNIGGDIFSFVMQREGVGFREALEMLADRAGVQLSPLNGPKSKPGDPNDKRTLYEVMAWAEKQFREYLRSSPDAEVARRYLSERRLSAQSIDLFQLGFSPDNWSWLLDRARSTSYSNVLLNAAGLANQKENTSRFYDFFRGRVIFPIRDAQGRPIAFGARVLPEFAKEGTGKYINSRETRLFSKNEHVYALDQAKDAIAKARNVIVVEGYMDVIMCHQHGIKNVVAVLGTAVGPRHIGLLKRYSDRVTLLLDGDKAGQRRTNEVLEMFVSGEVDLRIATLPDELDPCEFLEERSADDFQQLIENASDAFEHAMNVQMRGIDLIRDTHRANRALDALLSTIARSPRLTNDTSTSKVVRERQVVARLARDFSVDEAILRQRISELRVREETPRRPPEIQSRPETISVRHLSPLEAELFEILVRHPELVETACGELSTDQLAAGPGRQLLEVYGQILNRGEVAEFSRVLSELEEPQLKNLLVELDERASSKEVHATADAATRLKQLLDSVRNQFLVKESRRSVAELEQKRHADDAELDILCRLIDQERKRQGIPAPTDG